MPEAATGSGIRFLDSMPRPVIVAFLAFAATGIGLVVWLFIHPPSPKQVALELRRSPPAGTFTHNVLHAKQVSIPTPLPEYHAPDCVAGVVIEGGTDARDRLDRVLRPLCGLFERSPAAPPEVLNSIHALATAKIRFALFTRTGNLSTTDLSARRILLAIALARVNSPAGPIAPLLVHEGYHLSHGGPVTAAQEFGARGAEYEACKLLFAHDRFPRGCDDAEAMVRLGEARAIDLLVRAGYPA